VKIGREKIMENEDVCYTREVALEKSIEMEMKSVQTYKDGYLTTPRSFCP
jgi:hypothetical protein